MLPLNIILETSYTTKSTFIVTCEAPTDRLSSQHLKSRLHCMHLEKAPPIFDFHTLQVWLTYLTSLQGSDKTVGSQDDKKHFAEQLLYVKLSSLQSFNESCPK